MPDLSQFLGVESPLTRVSSAIREVAEGLGAAGVGAHQINCSDESERECVEIFHRLVVRALLPELKFWKRSSFRTVNLGARYEPSSLAIAEDHYAIAASDDSFKLLIVKLNTHVSICREGDELIIGQRDRYDRASVYCGAIHGLLAGKSAGYVDQLAATFGSGGLDRLAALRDPKRIDQKKRALIAAIVAANLQIEHIKREAAQLKPQSPTYYLMLGSVTLNQVGDDSELLCSIHHLDHHGASRCITLGDDPEMLNVEEKMQKLLITKKTV